MGNSTEKCGIGQPVRRKEDARLLTGRGNFSDDMNVPGQAYAVIARSPRAHARILQLDCDAERNAPGVPAESEMRRFDGDRDAVRRQSVIRALQGLLERIGD